MSMIPVKTTSADRCCLLSTAIPPNCRLSGLANFPDRNFDLAFHQIVFMYAGSSMACSISRKPYFIVCLFGVLLHLIPIPASGQDFDPNIQSTAESFTSPPDFGVVESKIERVESVETVTLPARYKNVEVSLPELKTSFKLLQDERQKKGLEAFFVQPNTAEEYKSILQANGKPTTKRVLVAKEKTIRKVTTDFVKKPRTVKLSAEARAGYDYRSNANTSSNNAIDDNVASGRLSATAEIPIGPDDDTLTISGVLSNARYDKLDDRDREFTSASVGYGTVLRKDYRSIEGRGGPSIQTRLSFGVNNLSVFSPGFDDRLITFTTPDVTIGLHGIGLTNAICGPPGQRVYCQSLTLSATAGHSWSDVESQNNAALTLVAAASTVTPVKGLTAVAVLVAKGATYTDSSVDREDLELSAKGGLSWSPVNNLSLNADVLYKWKFSSDPSAEWDGLEVKPFVNVKMKF